MADLEGMKNGEVEYIPDRLIADPKVFLNLTDSELTFLAGVSIAFWVPLSCLILYPFSLTLFGLAMGMALSIVTIWLASKYLTKLKIRQPDGLHVVYFKKMLQEKGLASYGYTTESQVWGTRRSKKIERVNYEKEEY